MELGAVLEAVEGRGGGGPEAVERVLARYNEEVTGRWGGRASRLVSLYPPPPGGVAAPSRPRQHRRHRAAGVPGWPGFLPLPPALGWALRWVPSGHRCRSPS